MAKTVNSKDTIYAETGLGRRARRIVSVPFILADARTDMVDPNHILANMITSENATPVNIYAFTAPCKGRILKVSTNATVYPVNGQAASTITVDVYKAVIADTDVSVLSSPIGIEGGTAETASHGTLSTTSGAINFIEGQEIYVQIDLSNNAVTARSESALCTIEWRPTEK